MFRTQSSYKTHVDKKGRVCTMCGEYKLFNITNFQERVGHSTGWESACKICQKKMLGKVKPESERKVSFDKRVMEEFGYAKYQLTHQQKTYNIRAHRRSGKYSRMFAACVDESNIDSEIERCLVKGKV